MRRKRRNMAMNEKPKILIADDSEINRALLKEILGDGYDYLEAEDGAAAVELMRQRTDISLLLLDLMMPGMDGFDVLRVMKYHAWLDEIPVIVISATEDTANIERAYDLGVTDYIRRPFERIMVLRRVKNVLMLYAKQKRLTRLVTDQVYEKEHNSVLMISILSHVVEFRNSESGLHVLHIRTLTDLLLHRLVQKTDRYQLDESDIEKLQAAKTEAKTAFVSKIGSLLGSGKLKEVEQHNRKLCELVTDREQYIAELHEKIQRIEDSHGKQLDEMQRKHQSEVANLESKHSTEVTMLNNIIRRAKRWFPMLEARLQMEDLCRKIGFTVEQIGVLLTGKALNFSGSLYSEEHRRKFNVENAEIKVFSDSTKPNQLFLYINRQPIIEWFKEQWNISKDISAIELFKAFPQLIQFCRMRYFMV